MAIFWLSFDSAQRPKKWRGKRRKKKPVHKYSQTKHRALMKLPLVFRQTHSSTLNILWLSVTPDTSSGKTGDLTAASCRDDKKTAKSDRKIAKDNHNPALLNVIKLSQVTFRWDLLERWMILFLFHCFYVYCLFIYTHSSFFPTPCNGGWRPDFFFFFYNSCWFSSMTLTYSTLTCS